MSKVTQIKRYLVIAMTMILTLACLSITPLKSKAAGGENFDKSGVLQINVSHVDANTGNKTLLMSGSGFLISDSSDGAQYVITCDHVVTPTADYEAYACEALGVDKLNIKIEVVIQRDLVQSATLVQASAEADFAILKLDAPIYEKQPLKLNPAGPSLTEDVYAMGYPAAVQEIQDYVYYSENDVVVTKGSVSMCEMTTGGVPYVQHSATITEGNSGGPLLDSNGNVVGLNTFVRSVDTGTYYYSLCIKEITSALDQLGIGYLTADGSSTGNTTDSNNTEEATTEAAEATTTEAQPAEVASADKTKLVEALTDAKSYVEDDYTEDSYKALQDAITSADEVNNKADASQAEVDGAVSSLNKAIDGLEKAKSNNTMMIIIIVAAVVVVIIVVVIIIVVNSSKKKKKPAQGRGPVYSGGPAGVGPMPGNMPRQTGAIGAPPMNNGPAMMPQQTQPRPMTPPTPPVPPTPPMQPQAPTNPYASEGAGETSVLGYGGGETSVLGGANQKKASLTRVKTNEHVDIVKQLFRIGKERSKVDYCITNNNSVSRVHADIVFKNGGYYLIDNNSTNYTFVNGQMIPAKQEVAISDGDRIKFAEEEFIFKLG